MRKTIRHPTQIPVEYQVTGENFNLQESARNISIGGISFCTDSFLVPDTLLLIRIPSVDPSFEALGRVVWCMKKEDCIEVGVEFIDEESAFRVRLIEQICYIREYQRNILEKEGRHLNEEEAAMEWTRKFADKFPAI